MQLKKQVSSFEHDLWDRLDIPRVDTEYGRYYLTPEPYSVLLPSVTTILSKDTHIEPTEKNIKAGTMARHRGNAIHDACEKYVMNEEMPSLMPVNKSSFLEIKKYLDIHLKMVHGVEFPLYSMKHLVAGTCDMIGVWKSALSIIDYKTSKYPITGEFAPPWSKEKLKKYVIQMSMYASMVEELYGYSIEKLVLMVVVDNNRPEILEFNNRLEYIEGFYEVRNKSNETVYQR